VFVLLGSRRRTGDRGMIWEEVGERATVLAKERDITSEGISIHSVVVKLIVEVDESTRDDCLFEP
jgi:hypothetical protein